MRQALPAVARILELCTAARRSETARPQPASCSGLWRNAQRRSVRYRLVGLSRIEKCFYSFGELWQVSGLAFPQNHYFPTIALERFEVSLISRDVG